MLIKERHNQINCEYYLVFVTRYRKNVFFDEQQQGFVKETIENISMKKEFNVLALEVDKDHVSLRLSFSPSFSITDVVNEIKRKTSTRWFRKYPDSKKMLHQGRLWSESYMCNTVGNVTNDMVNSYIQNQMLKRRNNIIPIL